MSARRFDDRHDRPLELAAAAVDFDLTSDERSELAAHLAGCPACTRRVAALRADARMLARPLTLLPSATVDAAVLAAIIGRPPRSQRLVLLAAAALLLLALLGAVAVGATLLRDLEQLPTTVLPQPSQPVANLSPDPAITSPLVGESWTELVFDATSEDASIEAVTFLGTGLVGVGRAGCVVDSEGNGECQQAAWTAAGTARSLSRSPSQPGLAVGSDDFTTMESGIFDVVAGPAGLVALGYDVDPLRSTCPIAPCTAGPAVWHSDDGRAWERVLVDFGPGFVDSFSEPIAAIAAGPTGYVMVGYAMGAMPSGEIEARATTWASPDGVTWTRNAAEEGLTLGGCLDTGERPSCGGMQAVVGTPTGFVAVGYRYEGGTTPSPAAWTSPDGITWTLSMAGLDLGEETVNAGGLLTGVTTGGPGLVAVGSRCTPPCGEGSPRDRLVYTSTDGSAWELLPWPDGSPFSEAAPLDAVVSTGGWIFALGVTEAGLPTPPELQLWQSTDGIAWQPVTGLATIGDAEAYMGTDLAAAPGRVAVVGWAQVSGGDGTRNFAYHSPALEAPSEAAASPSPGPDGSPVAGTPPVAGTLPVASGSVQMAPGPDGGLYVVISAPQQQLAGPAGRTVLTLLDRSGTPRTGWPIELAGWTCLRPGDDEAPWTASTDADGSLHVVCFSDEADDGAWRTTAFAFDPGARPIGSWPLGEGAFDPQPRIIDDRLHAISRDANAPDTVWMTTVEADGTVRRGQAITIAGLGQLQLGPDGTGYGISYSGDDGAGPTQSEIQAFEMAGPRAGWPVRIDGFVPSVAFGSDGRIYATSELDGVTSRTHGFDASGRSMASEPPALPIAAANEWSGAGPGRSATMLAPDGTVFVRGESSGRTFVFGLDPSGTIMDGWPFVSTVGPQWKGACSSQDSGCGVWQATNAVGSDGTLYLIQAAPHTKTGGSLVAIAPDGTVRPGWPVNLTKAGAAFWSVVVGPDGTAYALAIEPEARGRSSATILAIAPDSTVLSRTTVVEP